MTRFSFLLSFVAILIVGCSPAGPRDVAGPNGGACLAAMGMNCLPTPPLRNTKPGAGPIAVLGDSLANGYGADDPANKPVGCLEKAFGQAPFDISIPGLTTERALKGVQTVLRMGARLVFVSSGGNDAISESRRPGSYPEESTLSQAEDLFDRLLNSGAMVVYLALYPPMAGGERLPKVAAMARSKGVIVVDGMAGFWDDPSKMADQIHPNDYGYSIMCQRILSAISGYYP